MYDVLLYILGVILVLAGLAISIGLHELGHFVPAKLFGVKVTQFMIGFGKTVWSRKRGETEFGVKLIPLGGYVAMTGMYPPQKPGEAPRDSTTGFFTEVQDQGARAIGSKVSGLVEDARQASAETIAAGEDHRTFYRLPMLKKIVVMLGGPFMNLVLAFVLYGVVVSGFGVPQSTTTLGTVSECLVPADSEITECSQATAAAPAAAAGLRPGDTITAIGDETITDWTQVQDALVGAANTPVSMTVEREGAPLTVSVTPAANPRLVFDERGQPVRAEDGGYVTETVGMIGVTPTSALVQQPISQVPVYVWDNVTGVANVILHLPQRMVDVWNAAFGSEERDANGPIGPVGIGRIAGEIVSHDATPVASKAQSLFGLLASLNVALFVFNLLPLLPLDGGHVIGALYEGAKRRIYRLLGKPDPGPIDTAKMVPVTLAVVVVLGAMSLLLVYADLVKPVALFG